MHIHPSSPNSSSSHSEDDVAAATKIQARFRGYRVRKAQQYKPIIKSSSRMNREMNCDHQSIEESSAIKIQAGIRGFLVRKRQKVEKAAATKIQATFRGFKMRKEQNLRKEPNKIEDTNTKE